MPQNAHSPPERSQEQKDPAAAPIIDIKEGAKVAGYGEKFDVNLISGTPSFSIPIAAPPVRGSAPSLALNYNGTKQNGPFGLGFSLGLPAITRLTDKGIPRYTFTDRFLLSGNELTPRYTFENGQWIKDERYQGGYRVVAYRPRIGSDAQRIEWWIAQDGGHSHWVVTGPDNSVTTFGNTEESRISDPEFPERIFQWSVDRQADAIGNKVLYTYRLEDGQNLLNDADHATGTQQYIASIYYGNYQDSQGRERYAAEVAFDYGDYDLPSLAPVRAWPTRHDPFSTFRSGFHLRTWRRCANILFIRHFPEKADVGDCLSDVLSLRYGSDARFSMLREVQRTGYRKDKNGVYLTETLPPVSLTFGSFQPGAGTSGSLETEGGMPFPGLPGRGNYQFTDLWGDGISGMLYHDRSTLLYWPALGDGRYAPPVTPAAFPIERVFTEGGCALMDVEGNGHNNLVVRNPKRPGYYRNNNDGSWENFVPFRSITPEFTSPHVEFADMNADGKQDIMVDAGPARLRVYESLGCVGFSEPALRMLPEAFPVSDSPGRREKHTFANIFGDGLHHRVRLEDGRLTVWPCLGYGRFGNPVHLHGVPRFGEEISASHLFFTDVSGGGFDDLVLAYPHYLAVHLNHSGNGFGEEIRIPIPQGMNDHDQINWADVQGDGLTCLVLSKLQPNVTHHFRTFADDAHAYLLVGIENNFGAKTEFSYRCSTRYHLADKKAGHPWATKLSMPVHVIDQVRTMDANTGLTQTSRYQYTDGYYDSVEREFRGFAHVQQQDTQVFSAGVWHFPAPAAEKKMDGQPPVEPCLTRHWNHTGALGKDRRSALLPEYAGQPVLPDDVLDPAILASGSDTVREAYAALQNLEAAQAVYGLDDQGHPGEYAYQISGQNYLITLLQPKLDGHRASFLVTPRQSRSIHQDARPGAPLLADSFTLQQDAYGNVLLAAAVAYPRGDATENDLEAQKDLVLTVSLADYNNHPGTGPGDYHRIGVGYQFKALEMKGVLPESELFAFEELRDKIVPLVQDQALLDFGTAFTPGSAQARLMSWTRAYFWNEEQTAMLPLGKVASHALPHHQRTAVFPQGFVDSVYGDRVTSGMLELFGGQGCGYTLDQGYWWNTGITNHFGSADSFYSVRSVTDPFGATTRYAYDDYYIAQTRVTDALGQTVTVETDYQTLAPWRIIDINGNTTEQALSPLGRTLAVSRYGEYEQRRYGDRSLDSYEYRVPASRAELLADPEKFLQGAGNYSYADIFSFIRGEGPVCGIQIEASRYETPFDRQEPGERLYAVAVSFVDGAGRALAAQTRVEADALYTRAGTLGSCPPVEGSTPERGTKGNAPGWAWITSGQVAYDPKGQVVRTYQPYMCAEIGFVREPNVPCDRMFYDAVGRVSISLSSKGYMAKTEYYPWQRVVYDANDTVRDSPYYRENIGNTDTAFRHERDALRKAEAFYNTPTIFVTDTLGRDIVCRRALTSAAPDAGKTVLENGTWFDTAGNVLRQVDPRFYNNGKPERFNFERVYDMAGRQLMELSLDTGKGGIPGYSLGLPCAGGEPLLQWDNAGTVRKWSYDALRRPLGMAVTAGGNTVLAERLEYGTDAQRNTCGQIVLARDQAQELSTQGYTMAGVPVSTVARFPLVCGVSLDWAEPAAIAMAKERWIAQTQLNRIGQPLRTVNPDGSIQTATYYSSGQQRGSAVTLSGETSAQTVIETCRYTVHGDTAMTVWGNGVHSFQEYDPATLRLARQTAYKGGTRIQDISYYYDAVGNITRAVDAVPPPGSKRNIRGSALENVHTYTYDSLYRLSAATGRQQAILQHPPHGLPKELRDALVQAVGTDRTQLVPFRERYRFDAADNLVFIRHSAGNGKRQRVWTQTMAVSATANHAAPETMLQRGRAVNDFFDARGNTVALPHLQAMAYDARGKMLSATLIERKNGMNDGNAYAYDASGERRRRVRTRIVKGGTRQVEETLYLGAVVVTRTREITGNVSEEIFSTRSLNAGGLIVNEKLGQKTSRLLRFQLGDVRNSVTMELDKKGEILSWEGYFPFGTTAISLGDDSVLRSKLYRYAGKELDQDTGLYCMGQRYYATWLGRWLTPDPIGAGDGLNLYIAVRLSSQV